MTSHLFAQTTHIVAARHGFTCMVVLRLSYIFKVLSKSVQGFRGHGLGSEFGHSHYRYFRCWLLQQLVEPYNVTVI